MTIEERVGEGARLIEMDRLRAREIACNKIDQGTREWEGGRDIYSSRCKRDMHAWELYIIVLL